MSEIVGFIFHMILTETNRRFDDKKMEYFLNAENIEINTFLIFEKLMKIKMKEYYKFEDKNTQKRKEIPINKKSTFIFKKLLKSIDEELFNHLDFLKFQPIISCLKWVRLLFLRDFEFQQCLLVWDFVFKNIDFKVEVYDFKNNKVVKEEGNIIQYFDILDFICVAMFVNLKDKLMKEDYDMGAVQVLQNNQEIQAYFVLLLTEELMRILNRKVLRNGF